MPAIPTVTIVSLSRYVEWANVVACLALAIRIYKIGLIPRYPILAVYLLLSPLVLSLLQFLPRGTNLYAQAYFTLIPLHWCLYFALAYEVYRRVLEEHTGIASAGRWLVSVGLVLSLAVTALSLTAELGAAPQQFPILLAIHSAERAVATALTLLLSILLGFTLYFPVLLRRNSLLLVTGLTAFFLGKSLILLLRNLLGPETAQVLSLGNQLVSLAVVCLWMLRLVRPESDRESGPRVSVPRERAEEMLRQLGALNQVLLRGNGR